MAKATFNGTIVAESDRTVVVEGNQYFPIEDVRTEYFEASETHTVCPWKGTASYYTVVIGDERSGDSAWYYPVPKDAAKEITGHVAFWKGVHVEP